MLEHLGHADAAAAVLRAMEHVLAETDVRTADLGGRAGTREVTEALVAAVRADASR
jgi:tartrate dehydrogenase/decarboxylase/D-malate dehydrogenase